MDEGKGGGREEMINKTAFLRGKEKRRPREVPEQFDAAFCRGRERSKRGRKGMEGLQDVPFFSGMDG